MPDFSNIALGIKEIKKENFEISFEKTKDNKYHVFFKQIGLNDIFEEGSKIIIRTTIKATERTIQPWEKYLDKHSYDGSLVDKNNKKTQLDIEGFHEKDRLSALEVIVIDNTKKILGSSVKTTYEPKAGEIDTQNPEGILDTKFEDIEVDFIIAYDNDANYKPVSVIINEKLKKKLEIDRSFKAYIFLQIMKEIFTKLIINGEITHDNYKYFLGVFIRDDEELKSEVQRQPRIYTSEDYVVVRNLVDKGIKNIIEKDHLIEEVGRIDNG